MAKASPDQAAPRRKGRGRLSTIELLPEAADEAISWANEQLRETRMPQVIILQRFNTMLAAHGIKPVSKGAFSRYSINLAVEARKLEASRKLTEAILSRLPVEDRSDSTIASTELLKFKILEMVMGQDEPDPKLINLATLALSRMSITALREAHGQRLDRKEQKEEAKDRQKADQAAGDAAADGTSAAVDPEAVMRRIREDVYGIFEKGDV